VGKETRRVIEKLENTMNERLTKQDEMMQQLIHLVAKNTEKIIAMDERFNGVDQRFNKVDERFEEMNQRFIKVDERFDEVNQRFIKVDERFDEVNQRFIKVDQRFDEVNQRLIKVDERFDEVNQRFNEVGKRLGRVEAAVIRIEENEPANMTAMLKQINSKLDESKSGIQVLNERILKSESKIERLTKK